MARTRGRNQLAKNDGSSEEQAQLKRPVKLYPGKGNYGGPAVNFAGLSDCTLFPSPFMTGWADGWVSEGTCAQMLAHPKIYQAINILKDSIIGDGGRWVPGVPPSHPEFASAKLYAEFMEYCYRNMKGSYYHVARQLLDSVHEGNKIAAINARDEVAGRFAGKRVLDSLQIIPNSMYHYELDEEGQLDHIVIYGDSVQRDKWLPEKFMILCYRPVNNNPYGTRVLRPAYDPYYRDVQIDGEEMAYVAQFGRPTVIVYAPPPPKELGLAMETTKPLVNIDGSPYMVPDPGNAGELIQKTGDLVEQNAIFIANYQSGSYYSLEGGSKMEVLQANAGGADMFRFMRDSNGRLMTGTILGTHQVTDSERNVSTNNADVGEGVLGLNVTAGKMMLEKADEEVAYRFIKMNYGQKAASELLPIRDYGSGQNGRVPKLYNAVVNFVTSGVFDQDQWYWFAVSNQLPLPYPGIPRVVEPGSNNGAGGADGKGASNAN